MSSFSTAAAAALLVFTSTGAAMAQMSGFYLRGDAGYGWSREDTFSDSAPNSDDAAFGTNAAGVITSSKGDFDRSAAFQIGAGYQVSPMFRADLTLGHRPGFKFDNAITPPRFGGGANSQTFSADVKNTTVMLTGYLDLAGFAPSTFGDFQPYVGIGIGYARNSLSSALVRATGAAAGVPNGTYTLPSKTETGFAWSLTAGTAYRITSALSVDVGYRYLDLGKVSTDTGNYAATGDFAAGAVTSKVEADLRAHELTIGIRYAF